MQGSEYKQAWIAARHDKYVAEHGSMPLCECGCGEQVRMNSKGLPNRFAGRNHQSRVNDMAALSASGKRAAAEAKGHIPIAKFREVVKRLKEEKNWTWKQMAEHAGMNPTSLRSMMYDDRKKHVSREWARLFFLRAAGAPATPTSNFKRQLGGDIRIGGRRSLQRFGERL